MNCANFNSSTVQVNFLPYLYFVIYITSKNYDLANHRATSKAPGHIDLSNFPDQRWPAVQIMIIR